MRASEIAERLTAPWVHGEHVDLTGVTCKGRLDLAGRDLPGVDLSGAAFPDGIDATGARFQGLAWFRAASFGDPTSFARATFLSDARFEDSEFAGAPDFSETEFRGIARFDHADLPRGARFGRSVSYGNVSLAHARFGAPGDFRGAEYLGGIWCDGTHFAPGTDFADIQVHGRLWIRRARMGDAPLNPGLFALSFGYTYA
jgi:uncharacterized protein YjbI with pentapeptide repeats